MEYLPNPPPELQAAVPAIDYHYGYVPPIDLAPYLPPGAYDAALANNIRQFREQQYQDRMKEALRNQLQQQQQLHQQHQQLQQQQLQQQQMQFRALQQAAQRQLEMQAIPALFQPEVQQQQQQQPAPDLQHPQPLRAILRPEYADLVRRMRQQYGVEEQPVQLQLQPLFDQYWLFGRVDPVQQALDDEMRAFREELGVLDDQVADVQDVMDRLGRELEHGEDQSDDEAEDDDDEEDGEFEPAEEVQQVVVVSDQEQAQRAAAKKALMDALIAENEKPEHQNKRYSRECPVCLNPNPYRRAIMTKCGHNMCEPCALYQANDQGILACPKCRELTGYVRSFEELEDTPVPPPCKCQAPQAPQAPVATVQAEPAAAPSVLQGPLTRKRKRDQEAAAAAM